MNVLSYSIGVRKPLGVRPERRGRATGGGVAGGLPVLMFSVLAAFEKLAVISLTLLPPRRCTTGTY